MIPSSSIPVRLSLKFKFIGSSCNNLIFRQSIRFYNVFLFALHTSINTTTARSSLQNKAINYRFCTILSFFSEFEFTLGEGQVIPGWDLGLRDMCVGELRELVVPSQYGYGEFPVGDKIPPRALLVFYVELLKISDPGEDSGRPNMFKEIDVNGDGLISHSEVRRINVFICSSSLVISSRVVSCNTK